MSTSLSQPPHSRNDQICFFTHPDPHRDVEPMNGMFTCGIRSQHRGKTFSKVRDDDPSFVEWVLSCDDIRNSNLRAFAAFCRMKQTEEEETHLQLSE